MREETEFVPQHLGLIPDGNRRWAKLHSFGIFAGYRKGVKNFVDFAKWSQDLGIKTLTVWALSTENLKNRSEQELSVLFKLYMTAATDKKLLEGLKKNKVHINVIGDLRSLPKKLKDALEELEKQTRVYEAFTVNLLINYGGREDFIHSMKELQKDKLSGSQINEDTVQQHLRTASLPDLDLVVRTSGEMRLSGFLPWQSAYSELYFTEKYWPDFNKKDFYKAVDTFSRRKRRFGR